MKLKATKDELTGLVRSLASDAVFIAMTASRTMKKATAKFGVPFNELPVEVWTRIFYDREHAKSSFRKLRCHLSHTDWMQVVSWARQEANQMRVARAEFDKRKGASV